MPICWNVHGTQQKSCHRFQLPACQGLEKMSRLSNSIRINLESLATWGNIVLFTNTITIPSTWSSIWCPLVILISNVSHASFNIKQDKSISEHISRLVYAFVSGKRMNYLFHVSSISSVVRQLFPTFPAHKAGSSWPLRENTYINSTRLEVEHDV